MPDPLVIQSPGSELSLRSEPERIVSVRLVRWGEMGELPDGYEVFERGAFEGTDPESVFLRLDHQDPAVARGVRGSLEERADGAYMDFGPVARTARGDETLGLLRDGIYRGVSVGYTESPGGTRIGRASDGRRISYRSRVNLSEVGATWRPVFPSAAVMQVRSSEMLEPQTPEPVAAPPQAPAAAAPVQAAESDLLDRLMTRLDDMELRSRQAATAPAPAIQAVRGPRMGEWASAAVRQIGGERVPELELRALAEIVTGTNMGVVPDAFRAELLGPINARRPFLETTEEVTAPAAGTKLLVPRIITRPTVGVQAAEKDEVASTQVAIDSDDYGMETIAGGGDLSIQLLRRSSPEFLGLYVRLLAEAYAKKADIRALTALLVAGITAGGVFDPESPSFGAAYTASIEAVDNAPNRVWMSGAAYAAFVDAKEPVGGGGRPLYPGLAVIGTISTTGNAGPDPMVLRPVIVPALDALKAAPETELTAPTPDIVVPDLIVGPSMGFAWAEDGTHELAADNPAQAGRDVALVGMLWFAALYPGAFTGYTLS